MPHLAHWIRLLRRRLLHLYFLLRRPVTLGVRAIVADEEHKQVLLIRHTYVQGWHLPGGGVEPGESALEALRRELEEETGIRPMEEPVLCSAHFDSAVSRRDHVLTYFINRFEQVSAFRPNREIAECRFFPVDRLPADTHGSTMMRIREIFEGASPDG